MRRASDHGRGNANSAVHNVLAVGALLTLALGAAAVPAPANAAILSIDLGALHISTTTDTLPGEQAAHFQMIAGDPVRRVYTLHNNGVLAMTDVTVHDPDAGGAVRCGSAGARSITTLPPHGSAICSATFAAVPGEHHATITASGTVFLLDIIRLSGRDWADYTAVTPALQASLSLGASPGSRLPTDRPVTATVTVRNTGSVQLTQVAPVAPQPLAGFGCGGGGAAVDSLATGESATCTGSFTPEPGRHVSSLTIAGNWLWKWPLTAQGPQPRRTLRVRTVASAAYTGVPVPTPVVPPSSATPLPPPSAPPTRPQPIVVIPGRPPSPPPSPLPTPSPPPAPSAAELQSVSQFQASRGISLPLKVLVVVVIPAVAAATGARRIAAASRR